MPLPGMQSKDLPTELTLQQASDILHLAVEKKKPVYKERLLGRLVFGFFFFFFLHIFFLYLFFAF